MIASRGTRRQRKFLVLSVAITMGAEPIHMRYTDDSTVINIGFFPNVSLNSTNSETKLFVITVKVLEPAGARDQDATAMPVRHV